MTYSEDHKLEIIQAINLQQDLSHYFQNGFRVHHLFSNFELNRTQSYLKYLIDNQKADLIPESKFTLSEVCLMEKIDSSKKV
jgi:hypothetical protein